MTLLTYAGKYVVQSGSSVTSTSTSFSDDTQASQTFTLYSTKTVLAIYNANCAHGNTCAVTGFKSAINIDSADHSIMGQSLYSANYSGNNTCVWVGSLAAGSHTIKGRIATNTGTGTVTVSNRTLVIYIFDGDEFDYVEDATAQAVAGSTLADDSYGYTTLTPSAACKALVFYGATNDYGTTERYVGKRIQISIGGSDYSASEMQQACNNAGNNADSVATAQTASLTATSTTFKGRVACNSVQTITVSRRYLCVLLLSDDVIIDTDTSSNSLSATSTSFSDDTDISITRSHEGELLTLFGAYKYYGLSSAVYGTAYGIMLDSSDVAHSRGSASYSYDPQCALVPYAANVSSGSHTIKGRFATNYSTTATYITNRQLTALWFPIKTPLTYNAKYVVQSGSTASASSDSFVDDSYGSKTFTLTATQTVLAIYSANSQYGDTNNVGGFKNAINVDSTDHCIMYDSGYAADYPMRNTCVWIGTLASGEHTIKGRIASNTASTNTSITNRTLIIYVFDGDAYQYIDDTTSQSLTNDTYQDDTTGLISETPNAACKALILYGVTNAPGTTEFYVGKKIQIAVNGTDYSACQQMESSYSSGGASPDSVATAYALALSANTNYVFKGRVATAYSTSSTTVSRRFLAVLLLDDTTLLDIDSSTSSQNTTSTDLIDDPDISVTRSTSGELLAFYAGSKIYLTNSAIAGTQYGIMVDGVDVAHSRTSQAYTPSPNCAFVAYGKTVYDASHTVKGRFASCGTGSVVITNRCLVALWFSRTVIMKSFSATNDLRQSKPFAATSDIRLSKSFSNSDDIELSKSFAATNDLRLSEDYSASNDIRLSAAFTDNSDLGAGSSFSSSNDIMLSNIFQSLCDILVEITGTSSNDILVEKTFTSRHDIRVWRTFLSRNDIRLINTYSSISDLKLSLTFTSTSIVGVERAFSSTNYIMLSSAFESDNDILLSLIFSSFNAILATFVNKYFSSTNDILVNRTFESDSMIHVEKFATSTSDILVGNTYTSNNDAQIVSWYESSNDVCRNLYRSSSNDIRLSTAFSSASDIIAHLVWLYQSSNNILLSEDFNSSSDIGVKVLYQSGHDMLLKVTKSSTTDILVEKLFESLNDMQIRDRFFASSNGILLFTDFDSYSDIQILKEFASSNDIIYLHFDPEYPLTVIVSRDSRVVVIAGITNQVVINSDKRSTSVDSVDRTATVSSQDRRVVIW